MALINCPRCGEEVSESKKICPHCRLVLGDEWQYPQPSKPGKSLIIAFAIFALASIGLFLLAIWIYPHSGWLLPVLIGLVATIISIGMIVTHYQKVEEYNLSTTDPTAYQKLMIEKWRKTDAAMRENQSREKERLSKLPACPICGSKQYVRRLSTANRAVSASAWGLASSKIGKQYECTSCKHYF